MTSINKSEQKLFAVFGNPIIHSLSPNIFYYLFEQYKINADYLRITAETKEDILKTAASLKLDGFNITSPFKQSLLELLDSMDKPSQSIGAVNTVMVKNGQLHGYNTDYLGVINTLKHHRIKVENARAAILGAGGAARAAAYGLLQSKASHVTLLNRTEERARTAAQKLGCSHAPLSKAKEILNNSHIVISCLPSISRDIKTDDLGVPCTVMDANYRNPSLFKDSTEKGYFYIDGREWLINQALPAFQLFTGFPLKNSLYHNIKKEIFGDSKYQKSNLALIGFMGSGKTTVGKLLSEMTGYKFLDIDKEIEQYSSTKISDIFKNKGEQEFRKLEKQMIAKHIPSSNKTIFSLGGGSPMDKTNFHTIKQNCTSIWLWISYSQAVKRIDIGSRPLIDQKSPEESAKNILAERIPYYACLSDLVIDTETGKAVKIAERIKNEAG